MSANKSSVLRLVQRLPEHGWVYILDTGFQSASNSDRRIFKIGKAQELSNRIKTLKIQLPYKVRLAYAFQVLEYSAWEACLHRIFADQRLNGEWFSLSDEDIARIAELVEYQGICETLTGEWIPDPMRIMLSEERALFYAAIELQNDHSGKKYFTTEDRLDLPVDLLDCEDYFSTIDPLEANPDLLRDKEGEHSRLVELILSYSMEGK